MKYKYIIFYELLLSGNSGRCDIVNDRKIKSTTDLNDIEKMYKMNKNEEIDIKNYKYVGRVWK